LLKELIRLYISPLLKREGFKKRGNTWNKEVNGVIHVVDIQSARPRVDGSESFTINIGVFVKELWQIFWATDLPKFVKEVNCYPRFRLGYLLSGFDTKSRDKWWDIESKDQIESVGSQLEMVFKEQYLPFLDKISSMSDVLDISNSTKPSMPMEKLSHAILLNMVGDKAESDRLIDGLSSDSHWGARAADIKERLIQRS